VEGLSVSFSCPVSFDLHLNNWGLRSKISIDYLDGQHAQSFETRIYKFEYLLYDDSHASV
jgi:hypothetical protein